jgi:DNA (cytosine-5)-methyltransferase 1
MSKRLRVIDLFCGAGGFSEGFAQMGFEIVYVLDNWKPACQTHLHNHPNAETVQGDVLEIDPSSLPDADVIIGGPPCTEFSFAKKGGGGDITLGMKLVTRFLRYVVEKKPKYWIMENVPRLLQSLPQKISYRDLGIDKDELLKIPQRNILNSANFGAPQIRQRLFSGKYPVPVETHSEVPTHRFDLPPTRPWVTMGDILRGLPDPLKRPKKGTCVIDPNHPSIKVPISALTDQFYDTTLSQEEAQYNRKAKEDHSWYGRMSFPDRLNRPSRTIMATQMRASRETIAIEAMKGKNVVYRQPTVRECACLQCYPITYQFLGENFGTRYRLVGNSVPVLMSRALAQAILLQEGLQVPEPPIIRIDTPLSPSLGRRLNNKVIGKRQLPPMRKFRDHIPGSKGRGYRVDIDNQGGNPHPHPLGGVHMVEWVARFYIGSGKVFYSYVPTEVQVETLLERARAISNIRRSIDDILAIAKKTLKEGLPDATTMQSIWTEWTKVDGWTIQKVIEYISNIVKQHISEHNSEFRIHAGDVFKETKERGIPLSTVIILALAYKFCNAMNDDETWLNRNPQLVFRFEEGEES